MKRGRAALEVGLTLLSTFAACSAGPGPAASSMAGRPAALEKPAELPSAPTASSAMHWTMMPTPSVAPLPRAERGGGVFDPEQGRFLVFGGYKYPWVSGEVFFNDIWELTFDPEPQWTELPVGGARPLQRDSNGTFLAADGRLSIFGGGTWYLDPLCTIAVCKQELDDLWQYDEASAIFAPRSASGLRPLERDIVQSVYLPQRDAFIIQGGMSTKYDVLGDTWILELSADPPRWRRLAGQLDGPGRRATAFYWYDPKRDLFVVLGGRRCFPGQCPNTWLQDAWALGGLDTPGEEHWFPIALDTEMPAGSFGQHCAYDPVEDRTLCYGGSFYTDGPQDQSPDDSRTTWAITMGEGHTARVRPIATGELAPTVNVTDLYYDPMMDRFLVFGGHSTKPPTYTNEVWFLERGPGDAPACDPAGVLRP